MCIGCCPTTDRPDKPHRYTLVVQASVVIPCFNSLQYLPATLESVVQQTMADFEVVLVDDGGTDGLTEWAARWSAEHDDNRVRVVRQENGGVSAARNFGIAESRGDVVVFCDSDDLWEHDLLAELLGALEANPRAGMSYGWYDVIDGNGTPTGRVVQSEWQGDVWEEFVTRNPVSASAVAVRSAVFDDVGVFAVNRDRFPIDVEDWELWIRIAAQYQVALAPKVVAHHRRHDSNSSSNVESLAAAYAHLLDVVFADVTPERAALRPMAAARIEVLLAWHCLNDRHDPAAALSHRRGARRYDQSVRRSPEYWRLGAAAGALRVTGEPGYRLVRGASHAARRVISALPVHRFRREGTFSP